MRIGGVSGASPVAMGGARPAGAAAGVEPAPRTDVCSFSPLQQMKSQRSNLSTQVNSLMEQKQKMKEQAQSSGMDMTERIKKLDEKIERLNEQIQKLDQKIAKQAAKEAQQQQAAQSRSVQSEPVTQEEATAKQTGDLTNLLSGIDSAQQLSSVKERLDGKIRVTASEIKLDNQTGGASEAKITSLSEMKVRSAALSDRMADRILEVNDQAAQSAQQAAAPKREGEQDGEKSEDAENTESV